MTPLKINEALSKTILDKLRDVLNTNDKSFAIVVGGSIARLEASTESDIDYYFFADNAEGLKRAKDLWNSKAGEIAKIVGKNPSAIGAFGEGGSETLEELTKNIGGNDDFNAKITRRILFLLESTWLTSEETVERYRKEVLTRYVSENIEDRHLCRFLLNDVIRYYRTICVDFEFKTFEGGKAWGIRYIKLRFSRQLLYFSGLIAIAETVGLSRDEKINVLIKLFKMPPLERIKHVCNDLSSPIFDLYGQFLEKISDGSVRENLNLVTNNKNTHTSEFTELREKGKQFSEALETALSSKYSTSHLIFKAILF
jgi:hypothetical protein